MGLFGKILGVALIAVGVAAIAATGGLGAGALAPFAGSGFATFAGTLVGRLLTAAALTLGQRALISAPKFKSGIQTGATVSGEEQPESTIVGLYATAGAQTYPTMSFDKDRFLVQRIELSDLPGCQLSRVSVDGEWITLDGNNAGLWGAQATGKYVDRIWVKYFDGTQTAASQLMIDKFGADPNYPYDASMVGAGRCYAVVIAKFDSNLFPSQPALRFELEGIPFYDPRFDTSVGGSGAQRWATPSTWAQTRNPMVIIYNIMRGITLPDGSIWGGKAAAADLPLADWFAAMNDCDEQVQIGGGVGNRYACGFEIKFDQQPADVVEELLKSCSGVMSDVGGAWYPRAGSPDLPVFTITDGIMLDFEEVGHTPHAGLEKTSNALTVSYPDPTQNYEPREAPPRTNAAWEAEDGQRLTRQISLSAVPFPGRAQIIAKELHEDERRQSRHVLSLPRTLFAARPTQVLDFTSDEFGHAGKDFEIASVTRDLATLNVQMLVREVNPADFTPPTIVDTALVSPVNAGPAALVVTGFGVTAIDILDANGIARRPAFLAVWTDPPVDALGVQFELRITGTSAIVKTHAMNNAVAMVETIAGGILPGQSYDIRMKYAVNNRPSEWTAWMTRIANNVKFLSSDFGASSVTASKLVTEEQANLVPDSELQDADSWTNPTKFTVLPTSGGFLARSSIGLIQYSGALPVTVAVGTNSKFFTVVPGETLRASYEASRANGTTHTVAAHLVYSDRNQVPLTTGSSDIIGTVISTTSTALASRSDTSVVPAGAFFARILFVVISTDGNPLFAAPVVRRMNASSLVTDGSLLTNMVAMNNITLPLLSFDSSTQALTTTPTEYASVTNETDINIAAGSVEMRVSFRLVFTPPLAAQAMPVIISLQRSSLNGGYDTILETTVAEFSPANSAESLQKIYSFSVESGRAGLILPEFYRLVLNKNSTAFGVDVSHKSVSVIGYKR